MYNLEMNIKIFLLKLRTYRRIIVCHLCEHTY